VIFKHLFLGPVYKQVHQIVERKGSLDPREAKEVVFEGLYRHPPNLFRNAAAAAYYLKARLAYRARRALSISKHYDLPPAFYRLFLDNEYGAYSCAVFDEYGATLEAAQRRKLQILVRKLDADAGHRILDIGCGWGSFLKYAKETGLNAEGMALSHEQVDECRRLGFRAEYADAADGVAGPVDRIVTAGMMEHCKSKRDRILENCFQALPPGGRMVVQEMCEGSEAGNLPAVVFVAEEYFPGDRVGSYCSIQRAARKAGFRVAHLEGFGLHYRATMLEFTRRLAERFEEAETLVGYRTAMTHLLALLGFAWYFEVGALDLIQYILVKPSDGIRHSGYAGRSDARLLSSQSYARPNLPPIGKKTA
jgi:cyclopropane-fatty-acyl-phospholipid synthase